MIHDSSLSDQWSTDARRLIDGRQEGFSLEAEFFTSPQVYEIDEQIFRRNWVFAGSVAELRNPGDYFTLNIFRDPVVVLRDREHEIRAFHNVCRHHGAKVCQQEHGHAGKLHCMYHHWVYGLDGRLMSARAMPDGFNVADYPLKPVTVALVSGMIFLCLADDPPDIAPYRDGVAAHLAPHATERTKVAHRSTIVEKGNWKLVIENNRECYHCRGNHPEFLSASFETALPDDPKASAAFAELMTKRRDEWDALGIPHEPVDGGVDFRCLRMPLQDGVLSFTLDGGSGCGKLLGDLTSPDLGSLRMFRPPNSWNHYLADHIINFRVLPISPVETQVQTIWLVHEDAEEGVDYDVERLIAVWEATNDQDRRLVENNQAAIASSAYEPGPQSKEEFLVAQFQDWYFRQLEQVARSRPG